jgi:hypothetical protein
MESGRALLLSGDISGAETAFANAEKEFQAGLDKARNPFVRLVSYLPIAGRTVDAVDSMAEAGTLVARAARLTAGAVSDLPGGIGDLAPKSGALPVDQLAEMAPVIERARDLIDQAGTLLASTETSLLLGPVAEAREEFVVELRQADHTIEAGAALARELPAFLGADGTRRYFFGAQSPAELRGTGGIIGAYSILTVEDGQLSFGPFLPIQGLANKEGPAAPEPPNPSFEERYQRFGGTGFWLNINMTPDFPSAAQAIETLYADVKGEELDGTILADPFAYAALLGVTGPVDVPVAGQAIDANNAVAFLTNQAYIDFDDPILRKLVLGETAKLVLERFLQEGAAADPVGAARTLLQTAADGHVLLHAADSQTQEALGVAGIAGELRDPEGDYLGVFSNNAAANKTDFYLDTSIRYDVRLQSDGSAQATTSVELTNSAPSEGLPVYIIGPYDKRFDPGENRTYVSTYYAGPSRLESFKAPGELTEVIGSQEELGHPVFSTFIRTESEASSQMEYHTTVPDAWKDVQGSGRYTLTFQGQNTIRPTQLEVGITLPEGASIVTSSPELVVEGDRAVWRGTPGGEMRLELAFSGARDGSSLLIALVGAAVLLLIGLATLLLLRRRGRHLHV